MPNETEKLLKEIRDRLIQQGTDTTPTPTSIDLGAPATQSAAGAFVHALGRSATEKNVDPMTVLEQRLSSVSPMQSFLGDFLTSFGQSMTGVPFKTAREKIMDRFALAEGLKQKRNEHLRNTLEIFKDMDNNARSTAETRRSTQVGALESTFSDLSSLNLKAVEQENALALKEAETAEQQKRVQFAEQTRFDFGIRDDFQKAYAAADATARDPESSSDEIAAAEAEKKAILEAQAAWSANKIEAEERAKAPFKTQPSIGGGKVEAKPSGRLGAYGEWKTMVATRPGEDGIPQVLGFSDPIGHEYSKEVLGEWDSSRKKASLLGNIAFNMDAISADPELSNRLAEVKSTIVDFLGRAEAIGPEGIADAVEDLELDPHSAELVRDMGMLVAQRVVEFTGAQATDNERKFIATTLPKLTDTTTNFRLGIEMRRLMSQTANKRIAGLITAFDANGDEFILDASEVYRDIYNEAIKRAKTQGDQAAIDYIRQTGPDWVLQEAKRRWEETDGHSVRFMSKVLRGRQN